MFSYDKWKKGNVKGEGRKKGDDKCFQYAFINLVYVINHTVTTEII